MTATHDLVKTLLDGTRAGTIKWEQADSKGRQFIARRSSGTVIVAAPSGLSVGFAGVGIRAALSAVSLTVKNSSGDTIEVVDAPATGLQPVQLPIARDLVALFDLVRERVTAADSTIRKLNKEFEENEDE